MKSSLLFSIFVVFGMMNIYSQVYANPLVLSADNPHTITIPQLFSVDFVGELPVISNGQPNTGVAGAFSGIIRDKLIIAGGANFPDKKPWEGGGKVFHSRIYVYTIGGDSLKLINSSHELPMKVAYGASVSLPEGVLCIGGNDPKECFTKVFLIKWNEKSDSVEFESFPDLPVPLNNASAVVLNNEVYIIGGSSLPDGTDAGNHFFRFDPARRNYNSEWEILPDFPGRGRIFSVAVVQSNGTRQCIYVFSGRNVNARNEVIIHTDGMVYDPVLKQWKEVMVEGQTDFQVMAGTAFAMGSNDIVFVGGVTVEIALREQLLKKQLAEAINMGDTSAISWAERSLAEFNSRHPGFSNNMLLYNTITGTLIHAGKSGLSIPVTTRAVTCKEGVILTGGEIRPGVRTPDILLVRSVGKPLRFGWLNSGVLFLYFFVLVIIGYMFSRKQKSTDDYFKGGGRIPWWAAGISLFGTALSAITFMAVPAKTYSTDWSYFLLNMSIFLVAPLIIILFIPFYRKLKITSAYEYLELRFNLLIRLLGSISFILFQIGRMGIVLLLPSLALNIVTGMDVFLCILLMGVISLIYTMMGGIEAVIWTDVIQVVVLLFGALIAVTMIINAIDGGVSSVFQVASENNKFNLLDLRMTLREPTVWVMLIGGMFTNITTYGTDQTMVQRYLTTRTEKEARRSVWTNAWMTIPATILFFSIGTALFVFYRTFPEQANPSLENPDAIFPWFIASQLPQGLTGLLIAGIFAAAMSTLSSSMNSAATAYATDIHFRFGLTPGISNLKIARVSTFVIGLAGTLFALFMVTWNIQSLWDEFNKLIGLIIGSLGGLFLLGILTRRANAPGAFIGIVVSILVQGYASNHNTVHLLMYTATGVVSCFAFGWIGSIFFRGYNKDIKGLTIYMSKESRERSKGFAK